MDGPSIEVGEEYIFTLKVKARVNAFSDSHGECFMLELDRRDYRLSTSRVLYVNLDEIVSAEKIIKDE